MEIQSLKSKLVHLAMEVPDLRPALVPILVGRTASDSNLLGQLVRAASADPLLRGHVLPIITAGKPRKFKDPVKAKSFFQRYKREHPTTKKTWKDFLDAGPPKAEKEEKNDEEGRSLPEVLKAVPQEVAQAVAKAPGKLKQFLTDPKARKEQMASLGDKIKASPKATVNRIKSALKREAKEITGGMQAIGKVMRGKKLSGHDKKALYAVGVYAAVAVVGGLTAGMSGVGSAILHSFQFHIAFKAVALATDELFTHYESGNSIVELFGMIAAEDDPSDDAKLQALAEVMTVAISKVLKDGMSDEEMSKVLRGETPPGMGNIEGLDS